MFAEAVDRPQTVERVLERLERLWRGAAMEFDAEAGSPFDVLCRARLEHLASEASRVQADADYARRWLGRRAAAWSMQDNTGKTLASETTRAAVTVECLWSTGGPGAFATLEALRDVQRQLAEDGVRVVCLNLDRDAHLARRVIDRLQPGMTHVLAGPLRTVEKPPRLPIVRVLDAAGVVRRLWIGWRPAYAEAVAEARRLAE